MSQSSIILKFLCSRLLFCYMKCNHFTVFPHTASVSLTAGLHVLSQLLFFLSEILLCDIASPWFQSYFFCFSISELSSENVRTCFQIINAYIYLSATDFLQVGVKRLQIREKSK